MGAVIIALRGSDHKYLEQLAAERGVPIKDMAGVLLEQAIRRERQAFVATQPVPEGKD